MTIEAEASIGQEQLWLFEQVHPGSTVYHLPEFWLIRGPLDRMALRRAVQTVVDRHESLRTTLRTDNTGRLRQTVAPPGPVELPEHDMRGAAEPGAAAAARLDECARAPIDLQRDPPLRTFLVRRSDQEYLFGLVVHHVAADAWSFGLIRAELGTAYRAYVAGVSPALPTVKSSYREFSRRQRSRSTSDAPNPWDGAPPPTLSVDRPRADAVAGTGALWWGELNPSTLNRLSEWSIVHGATLFSTMLAVFGWVIARWFGERSVLVTTPLTVRDDVNLERTVGYFVQTTPVVVDTAIPKLSDLVGRVQEQVVEAFERAPFPTPRLIHHVSFTVEHDDPPSLDLGPLTTELLERHDGTSKFGLSLRVLRSAQGARMTVEYDCDVFDEATIRRFMSHFAAVAAVAADCPPTRWPDVPPEDERMLSGWSYGREAPVVGTTIERIAAIAAQHPDRTAVVDGGRTMAYAQLWLRAGALGARLVGIGVRPGDLVALCLPISAELVLAVLGAMRAGAAFIALDPEDPPARRAALLEAAGIRHLLVAGEVEVAHWPGGQHRVTTGADVTHPPEMLPGDCQPQTGVAYVTFTSGSTGPPKGVMTTQQGLTNYLSWATRHYGLAAGQRVPLHTPIAYDLAITSLLGPLVVGAAVRTVADGPHRHAEVARQMGHDQLVKATPTHWRILAGQARGDAGPGVIVVGGESLLLDQVAELRRLFPGSRIINEYGPTETVVGSTVWEDTESNPESATWDRAPIGRPIDNTSVHVVTADLRRVPVGAWGELVIGGVGVSHGYLDAPGPTADRFPPDPFSTRPGARLYRTGDLCRWTASGQLEFRGRLDRQVKIFGRRVELGEVEAVLAASPGVRQAAVVVRTAQTSRLIAYIEGAANDTTHAYLRERLPRHMVPEIIVRLDRLPTNANGKLDHAALPSPPRGTNPSVRSGEHDPDLTTAIAAVWKEELATGPLDGTEDYFALGGDSMIAVRITRRLSALLGRPVAVPDMFAHPTPVELAAHLQRSTTPARVLRRGPRTTVADLLRASAPAEPEIRMGPGEC
ncbi:amino acid adenylation domain-containing protein [Micromonospora sp. NPDC049051]|uniref:non-ribosomal peptide synthetase n=1 Tax=Micromonospora sp. NPDC049051 TaxID=3364264 RepID=UPI00371CCA22